MKRSNSVMSHKSLLLVGLVLLAVCAVRPIGSAQEAEPERVFTPAEQALFLGVARVCANEAFGHMADCLLIWQAVRRHGETPEARLAWLTMHSSCVLREEEPDPHSTRQIGNCPWTRHLEDSDEQPQGWPEGWRWLPLEEGHRGHQRTWASTRSVVRHLVSGETSRHGWPCSRDPDTWGGRVTDAVHIAAHSATHIPLHCIDPVTHQPTLNEGFVYRRRPRPVPTE